MVVICKICEKEIQGDKLSQHSVRCREVAKLKEDLFLLRNKMVSYNDKAQRMKNTLETQAIKERKLQQKKLLKKESFTDGPPLMRAKTQPMKNIIAAFQKTKKNKWSDGSSSSSEEGDKSLNSSKLSIDPFGKNEPETKTKEEYEKFAKEAKKSVHALSNVITASEKILNWAYNASSAPVDLHMKNELVASYEEIVDGKVSEFLTDFISDLSNYMELQNLYLKKKNETLADEVNSKPMEQQLGLKFMTQKSSSMRYVKKKETKGRPLLGFNKFKEDDTSTANSKSNHDSVIMEASSPGLDESMDSMDEKTLSKTIQPRRLENRRQMNLITPSIFKKSSLAMAAVQPEQKSPTLSSASPTTKITSPTSVLTPSHFNQDEIDTPLSGKTDFNRTRSKKNSRLIKADSVKILSKNGSSEKMPSILKFTYVEDSANSGSPKGSEKNNSMNNIPSRKASGSNFKPSLSKNLNGNLLKSLHFAESSQNSNKNFPSLQDKGGDLSYDSDSSPSNNRSPQKGLGWESPILRGYYSDTQKGSKTTRMVSLVDSPKVQMDEFEFIKFLGKGAYGTVWLVKKRATHDLYAMKIVDWADRFTQNRIYTLKAERDIYEILQGDYVVKALWTFHCQSFICFVTEFMVGGDFNNILEDVGRLDEDQARFYFAQLILAIESIHELGIVHRDLKPENILMDAKGHLRLTDFGLSEGGFNKLRQQSSPERKSEKAALDENIQEYLKNKNKDVFNSQNNKTDIFDVKVGFKEKVQEKEKKSENIFTFLDDEEKPYRVMRSKKPTMRPTQGKRCSVRPQTIQPQEKKAMVGTPDYMAPEIIAPEKFYDKVYHEKSLDWWSLGVILYQFLVGVPPFCDETIDNVFDNIIHRRIEWPTIGDEEDGISQNAFDLINKLLEFDPATRLGSGGADEVKQHPFFKGLDWENFAKGNGPIVPCLPNFDGPEPGLEAGPSIFQQQKQNIFNDLVAKSKETNKIDFGGFQLRRLDVLDKLNQDAYKQFKRTNTQDVSKLISK